MFCREERLGCDVLNFLHVQLVFCRYHVGRFHDTGDFVTAFQIFGDSGAGTINVGCDEGADFLCFVFGSEYTTANSFSMLILSSKTTARIAANCSGGQYG